MMMSWLIATNVAVGQPRPELPASWREAWQKPKPQHRPLQIIHGIDLQGRLPEGNEQMVAGAKPTNIVLDGMHH